jgi:hypothetical protein
MPFEDRILQSGTTIESAYAIMKAKFLKVGDVIELQRLSSLLTVTNIRPDSKIEVVYTDPADYEALKKLFLDPNDEISLIAVKRLAGH